MKADVSTLVFEARPCECGHTYGRHPANGNPKGYGRCLDCPCRHRQDAYMAAESRRRAAIAADPAHVHGLTHTAYACPGFVPFQVCDECGSKVPA
jgi:hypothetical protein